MSFSFKRSPRKTLCDQCGNGAFAVNANGGETFHCSFFGRHGQPQQPVVECSAFEYKYEYAPHAMILNACVLEVDKRAEFIGFRPPKKKKDDED